MHFFDRQVILGCQKCAQDRIALQTPFEAQSRQILAKNHPGVFDRNTSFAAILVSMKGLEIRQATSVDVPAILELYRVAEIESTAPFTVKEALEHFQIFARYPNYRLFVASLDGEVVGAYELLIMDNLAKHGCPSGIIEDVAVSPVHQGKGIGHALMEHARQECKNAGCYKFVLSSGLPRESAHRFYESLGMKRHGFSFLAEVD